MPKLLFILTAAMATVVWSKPRQLEIEPAQLERLIERDRKQKQPQVPLPSRPSATLFTGEQATGTFWGLDKQGIRWRHPAIVEEFHLKLDAVGLLRLKPSLAAQPSPCILDLFNGDKIHGEFIDKKNGRILVKTHQTGELSIPIQAIKQLTPIPLGGKQILNGFGERQDWNFTSVQIDDNPIAGLLTTQGKWVLKNQSLITGGGNGAAVGRNIPSLPDQIRVEMTIEFPKGKPQLSIHLFSDNLSDWRSGNSMAVLLKNDSISPKLLPAQPNQGKGARIGKSVMLPPLEDNNLTLVLRAHRSQGTLSAEIDGELVGSWKSSLPVKGDGKGILIVSRGNQPSKITSLIIKEDNGAILPQAPNLKAGSEKNDQNTDYVKLFNGDVLQGELLSLKKDQVQFETSFGKVDVPLAQVGFIRFSKQSDTKEKKTLDKQGRRAKITLADQSRISGVLSQIEAQTISLETSAYGTVKIPVGFVKDIDFQTAKNKILSFAVPQEPGKGRRARLEAPELPLVEIAP